VSESRRYPRLRCFIAVELRSKDPDFFALGNLSSIGQGGCGVETETPLNVGVLVEVASIEREDLRVVGHVVNRRVLYDKPGFGFGIEFADTDEHIAALVRLIEGKAQVDDQAYWYLKNVKRHPGLGS